MNKTQEALKMAIEAMKWLRMRSPIIYEESEAEKACKEALAQPAQEPVAVCKDSIVNWVNGKAIDGWLYTHPAPPCQECENLKHDLKGYMDANKALINREWQGLSDDVVMQTYLFIFNEDESEPDEQVIQFYKLIDQELKTKNGFSDLKEKNNA